MSPTATAEARTVTETIVELEPQEIFIGDSNPRKHFDPASLEDLGESLREKGQIEPVVVRAHVGKKGAPYELVVGERRWRAASLVGLSVRAVVRDYTDEQVLEIQLIENLHRKDLTPMEEARGYRRLIDSNPDKHSAISIAGRVGMSVQYVWDLLSLNQLIPDAQTLLDEERISKGHAILIARQKPEIQKRLIQRPTRTYPRTDSGLWEFDDGRLELEAGTKKHPYDGLKTRSVRELQTWIEDHIRFDVEHAAKAQPFEFESTAETVQKAQAEPKRGANVLAITYDYRVGDAARDEDERTYGSQSWKRADGHLKSKTCEYARLGLIVAGRRQGESFLVCVNRDKCKTHWAESVRAKEKAAKLREAGKGKQAAKVEKKQEKREEDKWERQRREQNAREIAWKAIQTHIEADAIAQVKGVKGLTAAQAAAFIKDGGEVYLREAKDRLGASWFKTPAAALLVSAVAGAHYSGWNTTESGYDWYIRTIAKPYGLDVKRLAAIRDKHAPTAAAESKKTEKKGKAA